MEARNKVVITGPTGVIGMALLKRHIMERDEVLLLCRKNSKRLKWIPNNPLVKVLECDLSDFKRLEFTGKYDIFYHLAWSGTTGMGRNDMELQLKNVEYALDAVGLAARLGCHTFIGAGSQAEYGRVNGKISEHMATFPENGYGIAKLCAGQMTRVECKKRGIRHIWARILSVYGPFDGDRSMINSTAICLLSSQKPSLTLGEQIWDYLYSADAAEALNLLAEKGNDGDIYCIGSGEGIRLKDYMMMLRDCIDPRLGLGIGDIPYAEKQVMYLCADISKLSHDTGFVPRTDFRTGIKNTIEWIKMRDELCEESVY